MGAAAATALPPRCADLLAALEARGLDLRNGRGLCLCPVHDDRGPSLSVKVSDRGIGLYCFAGCETAAVVKALGFTLVDLFWDPPPKQRGTWQPPVRRLPVKWYEYQDAGGNALYRKVRYEPKGFSQEWRDAAAGKWRVGLPPHVPRVLYLVRLLRPRPAGPLGRGGARPGPGGAAARRPGTGQPGPARRPRGAAGDAAGRGEGL
jgi:hypothetical protein